ncbi:tumor necrosis factor ligand superfamily member 10-like [Saccostrea cucullata]|uniref:tumor necrosis factor ligand superfamily member 10-like n=1 Tax=Saccostrea cuccullata TaxID=36930 RepID=UPI002ED48803
MNTKQCSCSSVTALVPPSPCPSESPDVHFTLTTSASESSIARKRSSDSSSSEKSYMSSESSSSYPTLYRAVTLSLLILCIALTASVVSLFLLISDLRNKLANEIENQNSRQICVPCADLKFGPFPEDNTHLSKLMRKVVNGVEVCCGGTPNQTSAILRLVFEKRKNVTHARAMIQGQESLRARANATQRNQNDVAAHLLIGPQFAAMSSELGQAAVRNWMTADPIAHVKGMQLGHDRIRINSSGLYYIYSQVYFLSQYFGGKSSGATTLYHYVYRYNVIYPNGGEELLLKSIRTQCWERNKDYDDYTSFTGGVFRLNVGDEIYVKVSNISQVSQDPKATFLGMFKLG